MKIKYLGILSHILTPHEVIAIFCYKKKFIKFAKHFKCLTSRTQIWLSKAWVFSIKQLLNYFKCTSASVRHAKYEVLCISIVNNFSIYNRHKRRHFSTFFMLFSVEIDCSIYLCIDSMPDTSWHVQRNQCKFTYVVANFHGYSSSK